MSETNPTRSSQRIVFDCPQCHAKVSPKRAIAEPNGPLCPYCRGALNIPKQPIQYVPWSTHVQQAYFHLLDMKTLFVMGLFTAVWYAGFALVPDAGLVVVRLLGWYFLLILATRLFRYSAHGLPDTEIWNRPGFRDALSLAINPLFLLPLAAEAGNTFLWNESMIGQTLWSSLFFLGLVFALPFAWLGYATGQGWLAVLRIGKQKERFRSLDLPDWFALWFFALIGLGAPILLLFLLALFFPYGLGALLRLPGLFVIVAGVFWTARLFGRFAYFNNDSLSIERISRVVSTRTTYKPTDLLAEAKKALEKNQPDRAEKLYREQLALSPINRQAALGVYEACLIQKKTEEALQAARVVIQVAVENGAVGQAAVFLSELLETGTVPSLDLRDFSELRRHAKEQGDPLLEARLLRVQAQQHPDHPETPQALLDCAVLLFRDLGKPEVAVSVCQMIVQRYPQAPQNQHAQTFLNRIAEQRKAKG